MAAGEAPKSLLPPQFAPFESGVPSGNYSQLHIFASSYCIFLVFVKGLICWNDYLHFWFCSYVQLLNFPPISSACLPSPRYRISFCHSSQAEPCEIYRLVYGYSVAHSLTRITDQGGSIAVDLLCVPRLWGVRDVFCEVHLENVGPLLQVLSEIGVREGSVCGPMPARNATCQTKSVNLSHWRYLHQHLGISSVVSWVIATGQVAPLLSSLGQLSVGTLVAPTWSGHASCGSLNKEAPIWNA